MAETYPGPHCQAVYLSVERINSREFNQVGTLTNGLVLELQTYCDKRFPYFLSLLEGLDKRFEHVNSNSIKTKLLRLLDQKKKLSHKKKVCGVKTVKELLNNPFEPPASVQHKTIVTNKGEDVESIPCYEKFEHRSDENEQKKNTQCVTFISACTQTDSDTDIIGDNKQLNLLKYENSKLQRNNEHFAKKLSHKKEELNQLNKKLGHYSVRNINKRDETARKNLHSLRNAQRKVSKQEKTLATCQINISNSAATIKKLEDQCSNMQETIMQLTDENCLEKGKKVSLQKANSYLRKEVQKLREQTNYVQCEIEHDDCTEEIRKLKLTVEEKEIIINELVDKNEDSSENKIKTKNSDGSYCENVRLCVIELTGLEVATEKVSPVIQTVTKHLYGTELLRNDLPNPSTVQCIVDEGHFLAKSFIAEKIELAENWGLGRDGTTRKKQKILDTSITLDSGDVISLGFKRVARETAETINNVTKAHLQELASVSQKKNEFVAMSLSKLSFTMCDRGSNEKLADKLLDDWRDDLLKDMDIEKHDVHHFHCMAHVLLGFHSYISADVKGFESDLVSVSGPIGRDVLPYFRQWSKKETFAERVLRTTAECFGPVGDHYGVRDKWEAFCCENGVKSIISNYRDNRFNAVFKTSAEVYIHRHDCIKVIETVEKPNNKLKSVKCDLESNEVCAILQCLGLYYIKFTGPYWNLVESGKVSYLELYQHVMDMKLFLEECETSPEMLLVENEHWTPSDPLEISRVPHHDRLQDCLFELHEETHDLLFRSISLVAKAMLRVVHKQLADFLPNGKFFNSENYVARKMTKFAPVTNLSCEHHFGDLDSSQRRRPRASFHHHSSVQLLKRNRTHMMNWIDDMCPDKRETLLSSARKGGRKLRLEHMAEEKRVNSEIHSSMMSGKSEKGKKRKATSDVSNKLKRQKTFRPDIQTRLPHAEQFSVNEYVAVAYQDNWYPGCVEKCVDDNSAVVKFMIPCRQQGYFQWPSRDDRQTVNMQFVLARKFVPDCVGSGRQWFIANTDTIDQIYNEFYNEYFD